MDKLASCFWAGLVFCAQGQLRAALLDFEGFPDSTILTNQYPDVTFTNAVVLTAGISLNEFEFPPRSGTNVVSDNGAPISISFALPVLSFSSYFTYLMPLTLTAFDTDNNQIGQAVSLFNTNMALSGDPGSTPNELLQVSFSGGIAYVVISGDQFGGSFTMDDLAFTPVPDPSTLSLLLTAAGVVLLLRPKTQHL